MRNGFNIQIDHKVTQKKNFSVCFMLDIQKFRYVNSIYGVEMGGLRSAKSLSFWRKLKTMWSFGVHNDLFAVIMDESLQGCRCMWIQSRRGSVSRGSCQAGNVVLLILVLQCANFPDYFGSHNGAYETAEIYDEKYEKNPMTPPCCSAMIRWLKHAADMKWWSRRWLRRPR